MFAYDDQADSIDTFVEDGSSPTPATIPTPCKVNPYIEINANPDIIPKPWSHSQSLTDAFHSGWSDMWHLDAKLGIVRAVICKNKHIYVP